MFVVNKLSVQFGSIDALRDVTATIPAGRVTAIIGPNAAGKSTLLRCLIGAQSPTSGAVTLDGENIRTIPPRRLAKRIAYVAQRPLVSAAFTAREVVELGRYALAPDHKIVEHAMMEMDVLDLTDRVLPNLSAGQQQRVSVARALAQLPSEGDGIGALIMDEPTSAMDLRHAQRCTTVMRNLAQRGHAVIVSIHDLILAGAVADDVLLLDEGRVIAHGPKEVVLTRDVLSGVFDVEFEMVKRADGTGVLMPATGPGV